MHWFKIVLIVCFGISVFAHMVGIGRYSDNEKRMAQEFLAAIIQSLLLAGICIYV